MIFEDFLDDNFEENYLNKNEDETKIVGFLLKDCYNKNRSEGCKGCICSVTDDITLEDLHNQLIQLVLSNNPETSGEIQIDRKIIKTSIFNTINSVENLKENFKDANEFKIKGKSDEIIDLIQAIMGADRSIIETLFNLEEES